MCSCYTVIAHPKQQQLSFILFYAPSLSWWVYVGNKVDIRMTTLRGNKRLLAGLLLTEIVHGDESAREKSSRERKSL